MYGAESTSVAQLDVTLPEGSPQPQPVPAKNHDSGDMFLYEALARVSFPRSYLGKIMLVAFVGTHIPLLTLFGYSLLVANIDSAVKLQVMIVALSATLAGTAVTLLVLRGLLRPIDETCEGLRRYLEKGIVPELPTDYTDEAGVLMADTMETISQLDGAIHQLRHYDPLTALPNREMFRRTLELELLRNRDAGEQVMVLLLDLDRFSDINNSLGQAHGDAVLRQVAQRLVRCMEGADVLSRIGSDEFAMLRARCGSLEEVSQLAQQLLDALAEPLRVGRSELHVSASVGIALWSPSEGVETQPLMTNAGTALRLAKAQGGAAYRFHAQDMNDELRDRLELERDLRYAIERGELELVFQPKVALSQGRFSGAEVLLRWHHPTRGSVSPSVFIPLAEACGLISTIGAWVLRETCEQGAAWQAAGLGDVRLAVNLSAAQFADVGLVEFIAETLRETGLDAGSLELELTETMVMENASRAVEVLERLKALGVGLALDDFGTGYSSLSYLKRFSVDLIKIDRSFISGVSTDKSDAAMVRSIVAMAHGLGLNVVAEGVESPDQVRFLKQNGCDVLQGYYFSRPLRAGAFCELWSDQEASLDEVLPPDVVADALRPVLVRQP